MENLILVAADLGSFDIDDINLEAILFQTGYLTIDTVEMLGDEKSFHLP